MSAAAQSFAPAHVSKFSSPKEDKTGGKLTVCPKSPDVRKFKSQRHRRLTAEAAQRLANRSKKAFSALINTAPTYDDDEKTATSSPVLSPDVASHKRSSESFQEPTDQRKRARLWCVKEEETSSQDQDASPDLGVLAEAAQFLEQDTTKTTPAVVAPPVAAPTSAAAAVHPNLLRQTALIESAKTCAELFSTEHSTTKEPTHWCVLKHGTILRWKQCETPVVSESKRANVVAYALHMLAKISASYSSTFFDQNSYRIDGRSGSDWKILSAASANAVFGVATHQTKAMRQYFGDGMSARQRMRRDLEAPSVWVTCHDL